MSAKEKYEQTKLPMVPIRDVVIFPFMMVPFVIVDVTFFSANLMKLFEGAWAPLLFGSAMVMLIVTWQRGSRILVQKTRRVEVPVRSVWMATGNAVTPASGARWTP